MADGAAVFKKVTCENISSVGTWAQCVIMTNVTLVCQDGIQTRIGANGLFSNISYLSSSTIAMCLLQISIILLGVTCTSFVLRPLGLPIHSQMIGGVIIMGLLFPAKYPSDHPLLPEPVLYTLRTIAWFGFQLYSFMLGVETNMGIIRRIGKKSFTICFAGVGGCIALSLISIQLFNMYSPGTIIPAQMMRVILLQSQNFFAVTNSHVNDLGISNSELGRLASTVTLVIDIISIVGSFLVFNVVFAILHGNYWQPVIITGGYAFIFLVCRPVMLKIISLTPEGHPMKQTHFIALIITLFVIMITTDFMGQQFAVYLFALFIPQEPLTSILAEKFDVMASGFLFPMFCAMHGYQTKFSSLKDFKRSAGIEVVLIAGQVGKFLATLYSARCLSISWRKSVSLALIIICKGFMDIITGYNFKQVAFVTELQYTVMSLHILITTTIVLPLVRKLYEPSEQYHTVFRQNVATSAESGSLKTLACIYNEENVHGILQLLESLNPSRANPIPVVTVQLIQLTGRCSLPIMAPFHEVKSYAALHGNIARCNRIVNAFSYLGRKFRGHVRLQHYVSVASYATMHNDICNLAYEKSVSLIIIPFHVRWSTVDGTIEESSPAIREVNKTVFAKAPCSVALLIDRGNKDLVQAQLNQTNDDLYRVTVFYIGGLDDREAIAYCDYFANHPFITLTVVWLNSEPTDSRSSKAEYEFFDKYLNRNRKKIDFQEVICNDGSATSAIVNSLGQEADLVVVGKNHDPECRPLIGLDGAWMEYPELGVLANYLVANDKFSVLVVQEESQLWDENSSALNK